jgi:chemotaxis response regulator CheB
VYVLDDTLHASALVAGHSKLSRRRLREAVRSECQRVIEACDAAEAFELSRRYVPDLIVLEVETSNDVAALTKIREDAELAGVPLICLPDAVEPAELTARVHAVLYDG